MSDILEEGLPKNFETFLVTEDRTDERDYIFEDHFWDEFGNWLTQIWNNKKMEIRDQYDQKLTYKACSWYWLCAIFNWYNVEEYKMQWLKFDQENPKWKWKAFQEMRWYPDIWASLQDQMKFYIKNGWIEWYMRSNTLQWTKNSLDNGFLIYTWSNKCDWRKTGASWIFVKKLNWGGHCFSIIGYNEKWFIAVNSFGYDWGDDGYFIIPFENYNDLFSKNIIFDKDDTWIIKNLNYENEYKKAIELWITNWTRPDDNVSRKEGAVMAYRASKIVE